VADGAKRFTRGWRDAACASVRSIAAPCSRLYFDGALARWLNAARHERTGDVKQAAMLRRLHAVACGFCCLIALCGAGVAYLIRDLCRSAAECCCRPSGYGAPARLYQVHLPASLPAGDALSRIAHSAGAITMAAEELKAERWA